jgi:hypothetical protein
MWNKTRERFLIVGNLLNLLHWGLGDISWDLLRIWRLFFSSILKCTSVPVHSRRCKKSQISITDLFFKVSYTLNGLPQKKSLVFLGLFYSFRKKKQLCKRIFFNSSPFSSRKLNLRTTPHVPVDFLPKNRKNRYFCIFKSSFYGEKELELKKFLLQSCFFLRYE